MGLESIAAVAGIASAGVGIAGAAGAFGGNDASFAPRNYYQEITDTARAQQQVAPMQLATQREFQPQQTALNLQNLRNFLSGTPGGSSQIQYQDYERVPIYAPSTAQAGGTGRVSAGTPFVTGGSNMITGYENRPVMRTRTVNTDAQPGLLDYYANTLQPELSRITAAGNTATRSADINDIATLGPQSLAALRAVNPQQTALRDTLYEQRSAALQADGVSPWEKHQLQQNIRGGQAAHGFGNSPVDAAAEAFYVTGADYARRKENQADAQGMIGLDQSLYGDPYLQITGRQSGSQPTGAGLLAQAGGQPLNDYNPEDPYAADVYGYNANASNAASIAARNRSAGASAGMLNLGGNLLGSYISRPRTYAGSGAGWGGSTGGSTPYY